MGIREQVIFPEIDYDAVDQVRGLDVAITTTAATDAEAFALLDALGMPFARDGRPKEYESLAAGEPVAAYGKKLNGKDIQDRRLPAHAQVQDARTFALSPLRAPARRVSQVRAVPAVPARTRAQRLHPRHDEVELVAPCR
jgi:hypothetical protein